MTSRRGPGAPDGTVLVVGVGSIGAAVARQLKRLGVTVLGIYGKKS